MVPRTDVQEIASRALEDGQFAATVLDGSNHSQVREAILQDLLDWDDASDFPIRLTQHPYRPGISGDLHRRFDSPAWTQTRKSHLEHLAVGDTR